MNKNKSTYLDNEKGKSQKRFDVKSRGKYYEDQIVIWREEVEKLSYEEALKRIDLFLEELENDETSLEDIQSLFLKGQIYLDHCDNLLKSAEQDVREISIHDLI